MGKWTAENIPELKNKVIVITGSSSGIGFAAAKIIAQRGAKVILAVRNSAKGNKALEKIKNENPDADVELILLDLADLSSVKKFTTEFKKKYDRLDVLINNAGVMIPPYSNTKDGFELQFGTNHLGHFALTLKLLDLLEKSDEPRIVNISSVAHNYGNINFDDLNWEKRKYIGWRAYGDSKIANLYFTYELARKLKDKGSKIVVTAAHPGWTATDLQRYSGFFRFLNNFFAMKPEQGTLPTLRAAFDKSAESGDFFGPDGFRELRGYPVKVQSNKLSHNKDIARKLWDISEKLTNTKLK